MLQITVDCTNADAMLDGAAKQIPYAMSVAINRTASDFRDLMRQAVAQRFTLRKPAFARANFSYYGSSGTRGSNKDDNPMWAAVGLEAPGVGGRSLFAKFEAGGVKTAMDPAAPIAIPSVNVRPSFAQLPPLALYPKNLGLMPRKGIVGIVAAKKHVTARGVVQLKGSSRTFVLDASTMFGVKVTGVYQRTGPGKADIRLLWTYKTSIPIPALLHFYETAQRVIPMQFAANWGRAWTMALATAKP